MTDTLWRSLPAPLPPALTAVPPRCALCPLPSPPLPLSSLPPTLPSSPHPDDGPCCDCKSRCELMCPCNPCREDMCRPSQKRQCWNVKKKDLPAGEGLQLRARTQSTGAYVVPSESSIPLEKVPVTPSRSPSTRRKREEGEREEGGTPSKRGKVAMRLNVIDMSGEEEASPQNALSFLSSLPASSSPLPAKFKQQVREDRRRRTE